jgi:TM2 domain-containing membrane protein YozV
MSRAGVAAVLSFLVPGLGQLYNGDFFRAIMWFSIAWVVGLALSPLSMGVASFLYHMWCAWAAYSRAEAKFGRSALPPQVKF